MRLTLRGMSTKLVDKYVGKLSRIGVNPAALLDFTQIAQNSGRA
jgi:hypothetical protein